MEFEIGDDPQGVPDMPEASRSAGIDSRPIFLFHGSPDDPLEFDDDARAENRSLHQTV